MQIAAELNTDRDTERERESEERHGEIQTDREMGKDS